MIECERSNVLIGVTSAIHYVRRGGKLVVYGVYANKDRVSWPPSKICESHKVDLITIQ